MYCPKCGQQQVSAEMRFCSRCGLPISGLAEWVERGGSLAVAEEEPAVVVASPRRKRIRRGAKLMFVSLVMMPVFIFVSLMAEEGAPLLLPFVIFFVGLILMLYALIFGEETAPVKSQPAQPARVGTMFGNAALPPASNLRTSSVGAPAVRTAELAQPPSVTEHTTRLLDRDDK